MWLTFGQDKAQTRFRGRLWFGSNGLTDTELSAGKSEDVHCCGCSGDDSEVLERWRSWLKERRDKQRCPPPPPLCLYTNITWRSLDQSHDLCDHEKPRSLRL